MMGKPRPYRPVAAQRKGRRRGRVADGVCLGNGLVDRLTGHSGDDTLPWQHH